MRDFRYGAGSFIVVAFAALASGIAVAQDLRAINQQWTQTLSAVQRGDHGAAKAAFAQFNASARTYVLANGRSWQIEYLAGSLDCLFPETRQVGAEFLRDILQNNRTLNNAGNTELQRQLTACTAQIPASASAAQLALPQDLTETSTHYQAPVQYQTPGVHGSMKGGGSYTNSVAQESSAPVSPINSSELKSRLVPVNRPDVALANALARLPAGAQGAVVRGFAITTLKDSQAEALGIGNCLSRYAAPLKTEFQIASSNFMVTAYAVSDPKDVYAFARRLHGLELPSGVIAYSVPEDMSLTSAATETECGSMAHELVHLLIQQNFPGAPAWLEEGLASEVAIASPTPQRFRFAWSWRDDDLGLDESLRPTVAKLLNMPWSDLSASSVSDMERSKKAQAMAAVFVRYLDAKGKLPAVYFAVRDRHVSRDLSAFKSYPAILEDALGLPMASIDHDFNDWFTREENGPAPTSAAGDSGASGGSGNFMNMNANAPPSTCNVANPPPEYAANASSGQAQKCPPPAPNQAPAPPKK